MTRKFLKTRKHKKPRGQALTKSCISSFIKVKKNLLEKIAKIFPPKIKIEYQIKL